jgi:hypothetical protein
MWYMHDQPGWQKSAMRLVDVFVDGLRVQIKGDRGSKLSSRGAASGKPRNRRREAGKSRNQKSKLSVLGSDIECA